MALADPQGAAALGARAEQVAAVLTELSNPRRLMILCLLAEGERSVGALQDALGLGQSALSQHLARLRSAGMVATRRDGTSVHYRIADPDTAKVMMALHDVFCGPESAA